MKLDNRHALDLVARAAPVAAGMSRMHRGVSVARSAHREWANKSKVMRLVNPRRSHVAPDDQLADALRTAHCASPRDRLWLLEGISKDWAEVTQHRTGRGRYSDWGDELRVVPERDRLIVAAGIGLGVARVHLRSQDGESAEDRVREIAASFGPLGPQLSTPAWESVGLAARLIISDDVFAAVARSVHHRSTDEQAAFHRGVGRCCYFLPKSLQRGPRDASIRSLVSKSVPDGVRRVDDGWKNAAMVAGSAWAVTLVNLDEPRLLAQLLAPSLADADARAAALNGVACALALRVSTTPDDPAPARLASFGAGAVSLDATCESLRDSVSVARQAVAAWTELDALAHVFRTASLRADLADAPT